MKIRRERVSAAPAQACSPQRSSRVDRDSPAVGAQRQRNFQLPGRGLLDRNNGTTSGYPVIRPKSSSFAQVNVEAEGKGRKQKSDAFRSSGPYRGKRIEKRSRRA